MVHYSKKCTFPPADPGHVHVIKYDLTDYQSVKSQFSDYSNVTTTKTQNKLQTNRHL